MKLLQDQGDSWDVKEPKMAQSGYCGGPTLPL
jgi:hypothetical protein